MVENRDPSEQLTTTGRDYHCQYPWRAAPHADRKRYVIEAHVKATDKWTTVLEAFPTEGVKAADLARYITTLVNRYHRRRELLLLARDALQMVMTDGFNFSTEQEAEHVINLIKAEADDLAGDL